MVGAETEVDTVEVVEAGIRVLAVVEVGMAAVVVLAVEAVENLEEAVEISEEAAEISEEAREISEAGEVVASTVVGVGVALGNREGTWPFLSTFPSNLIWNTVYSQRTSRRLWTFVLRTIPKMSSSPG